VLILEDKLISFLLYLKFVTQYFSHKTLIVDITFNLISKKSKMNINLKYIIDNNDKKFQNDILFFFFQLKKKLIFKK